MNGRRRLVALLSTLLVSGSGAVAVAAVPDAAAGAFCSAADFADDHRFVWSGAGDGVTWQQADNWRLDGAPAPRPPGRPTDPNGPGNLDDPTRDVDLACIGREPDGTVPAVVLGGPGADDYAGAAVAVLDLGQGADLTVTGNSRLWLGGHRTVTPTASTVRVGSDLVLAGATLGGAGALTVAGTLRAVTGVQDPPHAGPPFVVTVTTRWCDVTDAGCPGVTTTPGTVDIAGTGTFVVDSDPGATAPVGINLEDRRRITNAGTVQLIDQAFVAADHGVTIANRPGGRVVIANRLGIYEGRDRYGLPLPVLTNNGTVRKTGGGTSVIGASYQQGSNGSTAVDNGTLTATVTASNTDVAVPPALVSAGATYGLGSCPGATGTTVGSCTSFSVDAQHQQVATVRLSPSGGDSTVQVATQTTLLPAGHIGQAVQFGTPNSTPTAADPNLFVMLYDTTLAAPAGGLAGFTIKRAPDDSTAFVTVPNCRADGTPASGPSCVDRRGLAGSSRQLGNGDVRIVIRTTANSRYVGV